MKMNRKFELINEWVDWSKEKNLSINEWINWIKEELEWSDEWMNKRMNMKE